MKSNKLKLWRVVWIVGIYAILVTILYLVILYKVEWEHKDLNTYLYFYDCNGDLCTSTIVQDEYYSKYLCENETCPYIKDIIGNILILENNGVSWIYNYISGQVIHNNYSKYKYLDNDIFTVLDANSGKYGVINLSGEELVKPQYNYIDDYYDGFVSYRENNLYGIDTVDELVKVDANFEDVVLINTEIYVGKKNNIYKIYSYDDVNYDNSNEYVFLDSYSDIIFSIRDKKIDILTFDLNSALLMKIDTFYEYTTEKERDSLNLRYDGEYLYFDVFTNESEYVSYKYNIMSKKLV